jgi:hypothetical protein
MKKIKALAWVMLCILWSTMAYGQKNDNDLRDLIQRKNSIDFSLGGTGLFAAANYNRIFSVKSNYFINASLGIGTVPFIGGLTFPHQVTLNLGKKSSFLELGIGGTYWHGKSNESGFTETVTSYQLSPVIGWRRQFDNHLIFRTYVNPLFRISGEYFLEGYPVVPYLGISIGYGF